MITDPIANMLTSIRNAGAAGKATAVVPSSKMKLAIVKVLKHEGYLEDVAETEKNGHPALKLTIAYHKEKPVVQHLERVSKPGRRVYVGSDKIPVVLRGLGVVVMSTSKGLLTGTDAKRKGLGGEIICKIW